MPKLHVRLSYPGYPQDFYLLSVFPVDDLSFLYLVFFTHQADAVQPGARHASTLLACTDVGVL